MYFSPRLGMVYRANEKTVFRSGFGINWDPWNLARPMRTNYPGSRRAEYCGAYFAGMGDHACTEGLPQVPVPDLGNGVIPVPSNYAVNYHG